MSKAKNNSQNKVSGQPIGQPRAREPRTKAASPAQQPSQPPSKQPLPKPSPNPSSRENKSKSKAAKAKAAIAPQHYTTLDGFIQAIKEEMKTLSAPPQSPPQLFLTATTTPPSVDLFAPKGAIYLYLNASLEEGRSCYYIEPVRQVTRQVKRQAAAKEAKDVEPVPDIYLTELDAQVRERETREHVAAALLVLKLKLQQHGLNVIEGL